MNKRLLIGGLVAALLLLGVGGSALAQDTTPPVDNVCPFRGVCGGSGMGGFRFGGTMPNLLAEALGLTVDDLYAALAEGLTILEIADAQGIEMADLVAELMAPQVERLEQAVAEGYLTQEQAEDMIAVMTENMTLRLQNYGVGYNGYESGGCGMWSGGRGHRGGMWGNGSFSRPRGMWGRRGNDNSGGPGFSPRSAPSTGL